MQSIGASPLSVLGVAVERFSQRTEADFQLSTRGVTILAPAAKIVAIEAPTTMRDIGKTLMPHGGREGCEAALIPTRCLPTDLLDLIETIGFPDVNRGYSDREYQDLPSFLGSEVDAIVATVGLTIQRNSGRSVNEVVEELCCVQQNLVYTVLDRVVPPNALNFFDLYTYF